MGLISRKDATDQGLKRYYTGKQCKYGHTSERYLSNGDCIECKNEEDRTSYFKEYRHENKDKISEYVATNRNRINRQCLDYYYRNKHKVVANVRIRQIRLKNALPSWFEQEKGLIRDMYKKREELSMLTGLKFHVDHIVPIANNLVCGLHCLANLRIIKAFDNLSKNNKFEVGEN